MPRCNKQSTKVTIVGDGEMKISYEDESDCMYPGCNNDAVRRGLCKKHKNYNPYPY